LNRYVRVRLSRAVIVDVDDRARRLVSSARSERLQHHRASFETSDAGDGRTRIMWVVEVLPESAANVVGALMDEGCAALKGTLEAA